MERQERLAKVMVPVFFIYIKADDNMECAIRKHDGVIVKFEGTGDAENLPKDHGRRRPRKCRIIAKVVLKTRERLIAEGMPMQF